MKYAVINKLECSGEIKMNEGTIWTNMNLSRKDKNLSTEGRFGSRKMRVLLSFHFIFSMN